jgi:hypothetical protein
VGHPLAGLGLTTREQQGGVELRIRYRSVIGTATALLAAMAWQATAAAKAIPRVSPRTEPHVALRSQTAGADQYPTLTIDPQFGQQTVALDGVTVLARNAVEPARGALQQLRSLYGPWSTCDTGAEPFAPQDGRWFVTWTTRGIEIFTFGDPLITTCVEQKSRGMISSITLTQLGSLVITPYGRFRIGMTMSQVPFSLLWRLAPVGTSYYSLPLEDGCRPGQPVPNSRVGDTDLLGIIPKILPSGREDPAQHIAAVSVSTLRRGDCAADAPTSGQGISGSMPMTPHGGSGVITATLVGPLQFSKATMGQVRAWAGPPERTWSSGRTLQWAGFDWVRIEQGEVWGYHCADFLGSEPCLIFYGFVGGRLVGVLTDGTRFQTANGTRDGTPLATALKDERGHGPWDGLQVQCPGLMLKAPRGTVFQAYVAGPRAAHVGDLFVSLSPHFLNSCD